MKKRLCLVLVIILSISTLLYGCGNKDKSVDSKSTTNKEETNKEVKKETKEDDNKKEVKEDDKAEGSKLDPKAGTFPLTDEKITLKIFTTPEPWIGDLFENKVTKWYEEKTNVHVDWIVAAGKDSAQKINLILASQTDLPDAFMTWSMSQQQQIVYGSDGLFVPINDYIEKFGVESQKVFDYDPLIKQKTVMPDGNIYGLPTINECYHCRFSHRCWINKKWLDNLGLKMPETTEDFYNVLKAFKEKDANGNGDPNDEIPFVAPNGWQGVLGTYLVNPFIPAPTKGGADLMLLDGKLVSVATHPQFKDALKYLHKLYSEGLIDSECFTTDTSQVRMLSENPKGNRVGAAIAGTFDFVDKSKDTKLEYVALAPLTGPSGIKQATQDPIGVGSGAFIITSACKHPEIAFRWADYRYSDDNAWNGEEGVDYRLAKEGEIGLNGKPARLKVLLPYGEPHNSNWGQIGNVFYSAERRQSSVVDFSKWNQEKVLYDATHDLYEPCKPKTVVPPINLGAEVAEEITEINVAVGEYFKESFARFVTGDLDIDKDWDNYVEELKNMGIDRGVEINQEAYDKQYQ